MHFLLSDVGLKLNELPEAAEIISEIKFEKGAEKKITNFIKSEILSLFFKRKGVCMSVSF
jgi:hypothetical protein